MITKKTGKRILQAQTELTEALQAKRSGLKPWHRESLLVIMAKLDRFIEDNGLKGE